MPSLVVKAVSGLCKAETEDWARCIQIAYNSCQEQNPTCQRQRDLPSVPYSPLVAPSLCSLLLLECRQLGSQDHVNGLVTDGVELINGLGNSISLHSTRG